MSVLLILAQAAGVLAPAAAAPANPVGVISYPPSAFADQAPANAFEMLQRLPGFTLDTGDSVRGFESAAGNALVDGRRPTSKNDPLDEILKRIPLGRIARIDLIRGGAPGIDMQGKAVLANVVLKPGGGFRGLYAIANNHTNSGRNLHAMRLELSGGDGVRTWEATARYGYDEDDGGDIGPEVRTSPSGQVLRRSRVKSEGDGLEQVLTAAYSQPLVGGRVSINGRAYWGSWKYEETNSFIFPVGLAAATSVDPYDDFQSELGARFDRDFGARTKLELVGLRTDRDRKSFDLFQDGGVSEFRNNRTLSETIGRAVLKHQRSRRLSFELGGEAAVNELESHSAGFQNGAPFALPAADVAVKETRGEAFLKATWRPSPAWTYDATLRYEASKISSKGDVVLGKSLGFLKPRLAVSWDAGPSTQFRGTIERVVGQLNFDDFVATSSFNLGRGVSVGNPDLDPENAWVAEAAIEQRFWNSGALTLTYRHSELSDAIDRGPVRLETRDPATGALIVSFFDQPTNIGGGTKDELTVALNLPFDRLGWKGALLRGELNRRWSSVTDPTTLTGRPISKLRPLEWEANFTQDLPKYATSVGFDLYGGWSETSYRYNYVSQVKLHNAYLALFVEKRLRPDLSLRVQVSNTNNRGIRYVTQVYGAPRNVGALLYTDDRDLKPGPALFVRLRKTFG